MPSDGNGTLRARLRDELEWFERIDSVLLTTFGFEPEFFEQNVLPVFFEAEGHGAIRRKIQVNRKLASCPLCVFYDYGTQPRGGGEYRYQTCAVRADQGGVFHAKVTVVAGRDEDDAAGVLVLVSSANLTFRGWAHNEEIAGALWIETEQQRGELDAFLDYLERTPGARAAASATGKEKRGKGSLEALAQVRAALRELPSLRQRGDFPELLFSGLRRAEERSPIDFITPGRSRWDSLTVFSPYWSSREDTEALARQFRTNAWSFVPAAKATGDRVHLGLDDRDGFSEWFVEDEDNLRFRHAKVYVAQRKEADLGRVSIGSVNFTNAALGANGAPPKNVEALVAYEMGRKVVRDFIPPLERLDSDEVESVDGVSEESDARPPFAIFVTYDWTARRYSIILTDEGKAEDVVVTLPGNDPLPIEPGELVLSDLIPPGASREFCVRFTLVDGEGGAKPHTMYGLITEIGLRDSDHRYSPSLKLEDFFASWVSGNEYVYQQLVDTVPVDDLELDADPTALLLSSWIDAPIDQLDATNLFEFYRSLKRFEVKRLKPTEDGPRSASALRDMLVTRPDSVLELARLLMRQDTNTGVRYALLLECERLFESYGKKPKGIVPPEALQEVRDAVSATKMAAVSSLRDIKRVGDSAEETIAWFEEELRKGWRS